MKQLIRKNYRLLQISPWIAILSTALLTLIIVIFAANNLQREKNHMVQTLLRKSQDIIQFIGVGTRTSLMMGNFGEKQLNQLLEEAAADSEIAYILVVDRKGDILARSDPEHQENKRPAVLLPPRQKYITRFIDQPKGGPPIFELLTAFHPLAGGENRLRMRRHMMRRIEEQIAAQAGSRFDLRDLFLGTGRGADNYFIIVGLNTENLTSSIRQNYYQIIIMSVILLIVGLGGWLSLLIAQGYRTSVETLDQMKAFTGLLISRIPAAIVATDQENRIRVWNPPMEQLTGKAARQVVGQSAGAVLPGKLADLVEKSAEHEIIDHELQLTDSDNMLRIFLASALPVTDQQSEFKGSVIVLHDHTVLKNLEKKVRRHERLAALGKMAAGVAHEVRNPLSSIKGFATLLGGKFSAGSEEAHAARLLIHEVDRMNRSITELLNYAKPLPLHRVNTDLEGLLRNTIKLIEGDAGQAQVDVRLEIGENLPRVFLDRDRISQVLLNLYLNSLQAMENGGQLKVSIDSEKEGKEIRIQIADTGIGIDQQHQETIFDPYFTTKADGTGLGLALAAKIIEEHGGTITFDSAPGEGTTVTIRLPANPPGESHIEP